MVRRKAQSFLGIGLFLYLCRTLTDSVTGNTSDSGSEDSRFDP